MEPGKIHAEPGLQSQDNCGNPIQCKHIRKIGNSTSTGENYELVMSFILQFMIARHANTLVRTTLHLCLLNTIHISAVPSEGWWQDVSNLRYDSTTQRNAWAKIMS